MARDPGRSGPDARRSGELLLNPYNDRVPPQVPLTDALGASAKVAVVVAGSAVAFSGLAVAAASEANAFSFGGGGDFGGGGFGNLDLFRSTFDIGSLSSANDFSFHPTGIDLPSFSAPANSFLGAADLSFQPVLDTLPDVAVPEVPDVAVPEVPDVSVPEVPDVVVPEVPDVAVPEVPDVVVPDVAVPEVPDVVVPEVPDVVVPDVAVPEVPEVPDVVVPEVPDVVVPEVSDVVVPEVAGLEVFPDVPLDGSGPEILSVDVGSPVTPAELLGDAGFSFAEDFPLSPDGGGGSFPEPLPVPADPAEWVVPAGPETTGSGSDDPGHMTDPTTPPTGGAVLNESASSPVEAPSSPPGAEPAPPAEGLVGSVEVPDVAAAPPPSDDLENASFTDSFVAQVNLTGEAFTGTPAGTEAPPAPTGTPVGIDAPAPAEAPPADPPAPTDLPAPAAPTVADVPLENVPVPFTVPADPGFAASLTEADLSNVVVAENRTPATFTSPVPAEDPAPSPVFTLTRQERSVIDLRNRQVDNVTGEQLRPAQGGNGDRQSVQVAPNLFVDLPQVNADRATWSLDPVGVTGVPADLGRLRYTAEGTTPISNGDEPIGSVGLSTNTVATFNPQTLGGYLGADPRPDTAPAPENLTLTTQNRVTAGLGVPRPAEEPVAGTDQRSAYRTIGVSAGLDAGTRLSNGTDGIVAPGTVSVPLRAFATAGENDRDSAWDVTLQAGLTPAWQFGGNGTTASTRTELGAQVSGRIGERLDESGKLPVPGTSLTGSAGAQYVNVQQEVRAPWGELVPVSQSGYQVGLNGRFQALEEQPTFRAELDLGAGATVSGQSTATPFGRAESGPTVSANVRGSGDARIWTAPEGEARLGAGITANGAVNVAPSGTTFQGDVTPRVLAEVPLWSGTLAANAGYRLGTDRSGVVGGASYALPVLDGRNLVTAGLDYGVDGDVRGTVTVGTGPGPRPPAVPPAAGRASTTVRSAAPTPLPAPRPVDVTVPVVTPPSVQPSGSAGASALAGTSALGSGLVRSTGDIRPSTGPAWMLR
jgi:hypothetical protein